MKNNLNQNSSQIRIKPNDRINFIITASSNLYINELKPFDAKIIFKTSHKDFVKKIKIKPNTNN